MSRNGAGKFILAAIVAGVMTILVLTMMPTIQPVLVTVAEVIASITTADASTIVDFTTDVMIPTLPIILPIATFFVVLYKMSRRNSAI